MNGLEQEMPVTRRVAPDIFTMLEEFESYRNWRRGRAYDHMDLSFGVQMTDGSAGYTLNLYHDSTSTSLCISIRLSSSELRELVGKGQLALRQEG